MDHRMDGVFLENAAQSVAITDIDRIKVDRLARDGLNPGQSFAAGVFQIVNHNHGIAFI